MTHVRRKLGQNTNCGHLTHQQQPHLQNATPILEKTINKFNTCKMPIPSHKTSIFIFMNRKMAPKIMQNQKFLPIVIKM